MGPCRFKYSVFAQGEGFTSSKHRNLACGSLPIFLEYNPHDTYYGRFLEPDVHYKRIRYSLRSNATDQDDGGTCVCSDLDQVTSWALSHDEQAKAIGAKARSFAENVIGREMVELYVVALLRETAKLQQLAKYDIKSVLSEVHGQESFQAPKGKPLKSPQDLLTRFRDVDDAMEHTEEWSRRESAILTAIASMDGKPCPKTTCTKCCGNPSSLRSNPNRIVRSPCGQTKAINTKECPAHSAVSTDPWHRDSMRSLNNQKALRSVKQYPSEVVPVTVSGQEPAWKQWLRSKDRGAVGHSLPHDATDMQEQPNTHPVVKHKKYGRGNEIKPSGPWANKLLTQKAHSDPLAGRAVIRTQ
eukprot:CAMPEP_0114331322 /NCGR_PEP_ID=MMETSP0101-20121206/2328_1 /TAXON_ID=38822 ORGANISM="Pteridomonas danica, Strain PT" /NCGR_SAMPLE_ID=MMETSP0101 /ASSEMBLY_ACC=CAM_ASM_000211 /LENGTH=355 /DNA_ID=CAMNT_0001461603 /DNA_START=53 /DNA_END=1117 /DNA_ORIENTATION=+